MKVKCPLMNGKEIDDFDCMEYSDIANRLIKEECLPGELKIKNWREICVNCPNTPE